jgi:hypothetical protein
LIDGFKEVVLLSIFLLHSAVMVWKSMRISRLIGGGPGAFHIYLSSYYHVAMNTFPKYATASEEAGLEFRSMKSLSYFFVISYIAVMFFKD